MRGKLTSAEHCFYKSAKFGFAPRRRFPIEVAPVAGDGFIGHGFAQSAAGDARTTHGRVAIRSLSMHVELCGSAQEFFRRPACGSPAGCLPHARP